jgi:germination protein M
LYFASADGVSVVPETRQVYYSRNVSIDKLVMDQLLKGPKTEGLLSAIPTGTKLNSISISENGVCIVNFDGTFETAITGVTENATIYSIVNSLTELDNVKQVQILVNGETPRISNVDTDLSDAIKRNEDIINLNVIYDLEEDEDEDDLYLQEYEEEGVVPEE